MRYFKRIFFIAVLPALLASPSSGEVIDRVVAFMDNKAITLSELEAAYDEARKLTPDISRRQVLNTMINRRLLLKEARSLRLTAEDEDALLNEYVDLKINAFIKVSEESIREFYESNRSNFGELQYFEVKKDIEKYLSEKEVNRRLKDHIEELRGAAYVKVLL